MSRLLVWYLMETRAESTIFLYSVNYYIVLYSIKNNYAIIFSARCSRDVNYYFFFFNLTVLELRSNYNLSVKLSFEVMDVRSLPIIKLLLG